MSEKSLSSNKIRNNFYTLEENEKDQKWKTKMSWEKEKLRNRED